MRRFAFAALILAGCAGPERHAPLPERLLVVGMFGDTLLKLDGFACHVSAVHGAITDAGGSERDVWYDGRNAVATCTARPTLTRASTQEPP